MTGDRLEAADLVRLAYEGVFRPAAWNEMLDGARVLFAAKDAYYVRIPGSQDVPKLVLSRGVDPDVERAYRTVWIYPPRNPVLTRVLKTRFRGVVNTGEIVPPRELERSEFYDVCRRPRGVGPELGGADFFRGDLFAFLAVNRAKGDPQFGEDDLRMLEAVLPHAVQALRHHAALGLERSRTARAEAVLRSLDDPVLLRDTAGRLTPLNAAGEELLREDGGIEESVGPAPRDPRPSSRNGVSRCPAASVGRVTSRRGLVYRLHVSPCFQDDRHAGEILRLRAEIEERPSRPILGGQGFTPQESAVAALLCEGKGSAEICRALGIRRNTLVSHLKHLFEKTDCHSRAQLVAHLASAPGAA